MTRSETLNAIVALALVAGAAAAQPIEWAAPVDNDFGVAAAWNPAVVPGAGDTARLGFATAYTVTSSANRTVGSLLLDNPLATLLVTPSTFVLTGTASGPGLLALNTGLSTFDTFLRLAPGSTFDTNLRLQASNDPGDAVLLNDNPGAGPAPILGPGSVISGFGRISGPLDFRGTLLADAGSDLQISTTVNGGEIVLAGGRVRWNNRIYTGVTFTGPVELLTGEAINVGPGSTFDSPILVNTTQEVFDAALRLLPGTVFDGTLQLNGIPGADPFDASLQRFDDADPVLPVLGPSSVVTGTGVIADPFVFQGTIFADAGDQLQLNTDVTGGVIRIDPAGRIVWNNRVYSDVVFDGDVRLLGGEAFNLGDGCVFLDDVVINEDQTVFDAAVRFLPGVVFNATVRLNGIPGADPFDASLQRFDDADPVLPVLGPSSVVTGTGVIADPFVFQGTIFADAGDQIQLNTDVTGGVIRIDPAGRIVWNNRVYSDVVFDGDVRLLGGEAFNVGEGCVFLDDVVINEDQTVFNAAVRFLPGVVFDATVRLNGIPGEDPFDAFIERFDDDAAALPVLGPSSVVTGTGAIADPFVFQGTIFADAGDQIRLNTDVDGGVIRIDPAGRVVWNNRTYSNLTFDGPVNLLGGEAFNLGEGVTFLDPVTVNSDQTVFNASIRVLPGVAVAADIRLNGVPGQDIADANLERLDIENENTPSIAENGRVSGRGRIVGAFDVDGTIDPDPLIDTDDLVFRQTGRLRIDLAGDQQADADTLVGAGIKSLSGTLEVGLLNDYRPRFGDSFEIITASEIVGEFDQIVRVDFPPLLEVGLVYEPTRVRLFVSCDADIFIDGAINFTDVTQFIAAFNAGDDRADINGDGSVNFGDVTLFIEAFNAGCIDL